MVHPLRLVSGLFGGPEWYLWAHSTSTDVLFSFLSLGEDRVMPMEQVIRVASSNEMSCSGDPEWRALYSGSHDPCSLLHEIHSNCQETGELELSLI